MQDRNFYTSSARDIDHIVLNEIRHRAVVGYDTQKFDNDLEYLEYFTEVQKAIAVKYPFLRDTAERQIRCKTRNVLNEIL